MTDIRENLGWLVGSIATAIAMAVGWLISSGVVVNLLFLLVGFGITFFVQTRTQNRTWKREDAITMRDQVYGPIFREMSEILEGMESVQYPVWEITSKLKEMRTRYYFYNMRPDLKDRFYALTERLEKYQTIYLATLTLVLRQIKEAVENSHKIDISVSQGNVRLGLEIVKDAIGVGGITLEQTILQRIHPSDFIKSKKEEWGEDLFIEVTIGGQLKGLSDFESLYSDVLNEIKEEQLYQEEETQRNFLVIELRKFLEEIKAFIIVQ